MGKKPQTKQKQQSIRRAYYYIHRSAIVFLCSVKKVGQNSLVEKTVLAGTAYPSGASELTPVFWWSSFCSIFSFLCFA